MPTIRLLSASAWWKLANMLDEGTPGSARVSDNIMRGDYEGALICAREGLNYIGSKEGLQRILETLVTLGLAQWVVDQTPLKKSFTLFGFTIGL